MRLVKARVTNARPVEDYGSIGIDPHICLMRDEDAGGVAFLDALADQKSRPDGPNADDHAVVVTATWEMTDDEAQAVTHRLGGLTVPSRTVVVTRSYVGDVRLTPEADAKIIFSPSTYLDIVNTTFGLDKEHRLTVDKLAEIDIGTDRVVHKVEASFTLLPSKAPEFDLHQPAPSEDARPIEEQSRANTASFEQNTPSGSRP